MSRFYMGNFFSGHTDCFIWSNHPVIVQQKLAIDGVGRLLRLEIANLRCTGPEPLHLVLVYEGYCEFGQIPNFAFTSANFRILPK